MKVTEDCNRKLSVWAKLNTRVVGYVSALKDSGLHRSGDQPQHMCMLHANGMAEVDITAKANVGWGNEGELK